MTSNQNHPFKYIWPPLAIAFIIFYLSCLMSPSDVPEVEFDFFIPADKIVHFCMYFGLALVASCNYIYVNRGEISINRLLLCTILIPILYGGLLEILQANFFSREGDWWDFLANTLGVLFSIPLAIWFKNQKIYNWLHNILNINKK